MTLEMRVVLFIALIAAPLVFAVLMSLASP